MLAVGLGCFKWYQSRTLNGVPARMVAPIGWRRKRNIPYKGVETSPHQTLFKTTLTAIRNELKRTISASGGLGRLHLPFIFFRILIGFFFYTLFINDRL